MRNVGNHALFKVGIWPSNSGIGILLAKKNPERVPTPTTMAIFPNQSSHAVTLLSTTTRTLKNTQKMWVVANELLNYQ